MTMTEPEASEFETTAEAFARARARRSMAEAFEHDLLYLAIQAGRRNDLSVRQIARALRVPKSTVARYAATVGQVPLVPHKSVPPVWGNPDEFWDALRAIRAHDPHRINESAPVPYVWVDHPDGSRTVTDAVT